MKKIALITRSDVQSWQSCQTISNNLVRSYHLVTDAQLQCFNVNETDNDFQHFLTATAVNHFSPDILVFAEHFPHPAKLLTPYIRLLEGKTPPKIIIHIFGDFPLYAKAWLDLSPTLNGLSLKFVCASEAQQKLVESLTTESTGLVDFIPFPVDTSFYCFDPRQLATARAEFNLGEQFTFLYTGRISHQKQVIELIHNYASFAQVSDVPTKLLIAGPFDDLGAPYLNYAPCANSYFMRYQRLLSRLDNLHLGSIEYIGNLGRDKLRQAYHAADCFVSISTHNDEDFGMAPAEALSCGLPAILSDWGGYKSFKLPQIAEACQLIPCSINEERIDVSANLLIKNFWRSISTRYSLPKRHDLSQIYCGHLSLASTQARLEACLNSPDILFAGFTQKFERLVKSSEINNGAFSEKKNIYNQFYRDFYAPYIK